MSTENTSDIYSGFTEREIIGSKILAKEELIKNNYEGIKQLQEELDELLDEIEQIDNRKIDVRVLPHDVISELIERGNTFDEIQEFDIFEKTIAFLKDFFDITDDELENRKFARRFELEIYRIMNHVSIKTLEDDINSLQRQILKSHKNSEDITISRQELEQASDVDELEQASDIDELDDEDEGLQLYSKVSAQTPTPDSKSLPEKPILIQFDMVNDLELKLRELLKNIFSRQQNWWTRFIPLEIREKCQHRNRNDPDFENLLNSQSTHLVDKLMLSEIQIIITGAPFYVYNGKQFSKNYSEFFRHVFNNYHYVNGRLIEANILRNKICHQDTLNPKQQMQLEHIKSELIYDINEYLGRF